jgi:4-hydroxy-tetrahydrodipicolinate reductase
MKVALVGLGVVGRTVAEYLLREKVLAMALCREGSSQVGKELGALLNRPRTGITVESCRNLEEKLLIVQPDVVVDFSGPAFLSENLATLAKFKVNVVTAVTGYSDIDKRRIKLLADNRKLGVVMAPNAACGGSGLLTLARIAARIHSDYDIEVFEEGRPGKHNNPSEATRKIVTTILAAIAKQDQKANDMVPVHSVNAGGVAGRHRVVICGRYDQLEICHTAYSRLAFAEGAYRAARFICGKTGYYEMKDIFRLETGEDGSRWSDCPQGGCRSQDRQWL